jgi:Na+/melibiose symporter-like transporter
VATKTVTVWRSWFWNITTSVIMFVMAALVTADALDSHALAIRIAGLVFSALMWVGFARSFFLGTRVDREKILYRELTHTVRIPWSEVEQINHGPMTGSMVGRFVAPTVNVVRRRAGSTGTKTIELRALGSYGFAGKQTLADRASAELNQRLTDWRERQQRIPEPTQQ